MSYGAKTVTALRSELGCAHRQIVGRWRCHPDAAGRAAWAHHFNPDHAVAATFQTLPGASFVVNGAAQAPNAALTSASAEMNWLKGWSVAATFDGEFSQATRSYAGKGVVRRQW
ncbi:autotransporter outer membrane beta-barrel domain-containing protein [Bradyrhizobium sp.]|jgi:uncharacterized protein with beta-barrel porin domain|uniref:autotransporter outer membrane beta-barrel domain-containing protein n=1 Tax=Bradyrhizobium sp. TaxID=376 RepID=UPI002C1BE678|nr:autotransporter outer membrane beta-barrel domain-containing protein [Bradyrhizobium sp.]HWX58896.1 autotransporter outer membrane beta-barrel domain-containing protein [Bradyrhizobium sp.]